MSWRETLNLGKLFLGNESLEVKPVKVVATVGAEAADVINVALQLSDAENKALSEVSSMDFYLSTDAAGAVPATVAPSAGIAIGTDGALIESVANLSGKIISDNVGVIDIDMTEVGIKTFYLVVILPQGGLAISGAITFA